MDEKNFVYLPNNELLVFKGFYKEIVKNRRQQNEMMSFLSKAKHSSVQKSFGYRKFSIQWEATKNDDHSNRKFSVE